MLPFAQPSWFRKFWKWSTQKGQTGKGKYVSCQQGTSHIHAFAWVFASKFRSEISRTWSLPPMKECVLQVPPTIPSTSWCCGACLYPTTKITCEKKQSFGIRRLLGMEWNLGKAFLFWRLQKKIHPKNRRSWLEDFRKPSLSKKWMNLAILCALFGVVTWPLQRLSHLQLGDEKVTLNNSEAWVCRDFVFVSRKKWLESSNRFPLTPPKNKNK